MSDSLTLAAAIAAMSRDELRKLVSSRSISAASQAHDPLSLAIELLKPDSISRALQGSHRADLAALHALAAGVDADKQTLQQLANQGLVSFDSAQKKYLALSAVTRQLPAPNIETETAASTLARAATPETTPEAASGSATVPSGSATDAWFGQALTAVRRAAALLRELHRFPARLSKRGTLTSQASKTLAENLHMTAESLHHLHWVLARAGLVAAFSDSRGTASTTSTVLGTTHAAREWLQRDYPQRWLALAAAVNSSIDDRLHRTLAETDGKLDAAVSLLAEHYPLLPATGLEPYKQLRQSAEEIGMCVHGVLSTPALQLLRGDIAAANETAHAEIPAVVSGVYLQPDLSVIVPGPLAAADEELLCQLADHEQLSAAAVLRLSEATLRRALKQGISVNLMRETLARLSLTGIPQPLDFLMTELQKDELPALNPATFGGVDAPAAQVDTNSGDAEHSAAYEIADRVFAAAQDDGDNGALQRQLELAIRDKQLITLVADAAGSSHSFTLLPVSLKAGRLRASDQRAGVERTIPVSAITSLTIA